MRMIGEPASMLSAWVKSLSASTASMASAWPRAMQSFSRIERCRGDQISLQPFADGFGQVGDFQREISLRLISRTRLICATVSPLATCNRSAMFVRGDEFSAGG